MHGAHVSEALAWLEARAAIRDVIVRYARGVDTRDFELVESCFWPEVDGEFGGGKLTVLGKWMHDFTAENRFESDYFTLTGAWKF